MDSQSSTQPAAVRLVISILKRYSPGDGKRGREGGGREKGREKEGERKIEREGERGSITPLMPICMLS